MKVIPLFFKEKENLRKKVKDVQITLPANLWESTFTRGYLIKHIDNSNKLKPTKLTQLQIPPEWKGLNKDYRVKETNVDKRNYLYYRDLKIKILKYSVYLALFLTIVLVSIFSNFLSKV